MAEGVLLLAMAAMILGLVFVAPMGALGFAAFIITLPILVGIVLLAFGQIP